MNFFDDLTKLEPKEESKEDSKEESKEEPKENSKEEPKEEANNSFTELQAQITELKDLITKLTNKGEEKNDN